MDAPTQVPEMGTRLRVTALQGTGGMLVVPHQIENRRAGEVVYMHGIVGGHGGDVWWCKHENGDIAPYSWGELDFVDMVNLTLDRDEKYPFFSVIEDEEDKPYGTLCEFSEAERRQIEAAMEAFDAAQDLMKQRWEETQQRSKDAQPKPESERREAGSRRKETAPSPCPNCGKAGLAHDSPQMGTRQCPACGWIG